MRCRHSGRTRLGPKPRSIRWRHWMRATDAAVDERIKSSWSGSRVPFPSRPSLVSSLTAFLTGAHRRAGTPVIPSPGELSRLDSLCQITTSVGYACARKQAVAMHFAKLKLKGTPGQSQVLRDSVGVGVARLNSSVVYALRGLE